MLTGAQMTRRKVRDRDDAGELLESLAASGQSLAEFCRAHGLDGRSLNCWRVNLARGAASAPRGLRLVELTAARPKQQAIYRVVVDGVEVEVDDHFRADTLARLLAVVTTTC